MKPSSNPNRSNEERAHEKGRSRSGRKVSRRKLLAALGAVGVAAAATKAEQFGALGKAAAAVRPSQSGEAVEVIDQEQVYIHISPKFTGEYRALRYFGKLTQSNHSEVLYDAITAAADEGFKLFIPSNKALYLSGWSTPTINKPIEIEFQNGTLINSDTQQNFLNLSNTALINGIVTLEGFLNGLHFLGIGEEIDLFVNGMICKNMGAMINMRYSDNQSGSLRKAVIKDVWCSNLSNWGIDISPAVFGDLSFIRPKFKSCKTRFIGVGNNATGENASSNQIVRILGLIGDGLSEQAGITEVNGIYVTGCQNVYIENPDIRNLEHTSSSYHAEGIYIKAANTAIVSPRMKNAGGNQGVIVVKGSGVGSEVSSKASIVNAVIESDYPLSKPTCPLYVQADDVRFDGIISGTFTRPIQCNQSVNISGLILDVKHVNCNSDRLIQMTPNVISAEIKINSDNVNAIYAQRPVAVHFGGAKSPSDQGKSISENIAIKNSSAKNFKNSTGHISGTFAEIDLGSDSSAEYGKISIRDNDTNNLTFSVSGVSGNVGALITEGNDLTGGTADWSAGGVSVTKLLQNNLS
ncbi:hypothetical protein [Paenibacillus oceani]|uniref:Uncharacterized protein n=1 Tax=Paenibacillus oceani TaxID=2772510 RepID=A0A927GYJ0_9BACL|nr:hypothetical protein [Paenibacillus oceani]MBD2861243.1 hypothetical protein [Paenibacillus oceani]